MVQAGQHRRHITLFCIVFVSSNLVLGITWCYWNNKLTYLLTYYMPEPQQNLIVMLHICHCTCVKRPSFYFRSKIWCHRRVPPPWFPKIRKNFGYSRTFKADVTFLIYICINFQHLLAKNRVLGAKYGKGWHDADANELVFTSATERVRTDANRFYDLSYAAICYSYGTDN